MMADILPNGTLIEWGPEAFPLRGYIKAMSQNGEIAFVEITHPRNAEPKMRTLGRDEFRVVTKNKESTDEISRN
jgi:hypothetical protein